jgi:hypothetical protein
MEKLEYDKIEISERKLVGYILNKSHIDGVHKARFFEKFGFYSENWIDLKNAFIKHIENRDNLEIIINSYGKKYIISGVIDGLDGRKPKIKSIWFIENNEKILKFVTAYPIKL